MQKIKIIRITTVPGSLKTLLKGQLLFMSKYFEVVGIASKGKELKEIELAEKISTFPINMTRKITPLKDLLSLIKLVSFYLKEKPSIVHTHTPKAGILGMLAARLSGVPICLHTVAGLPLMEASGFKRRILNVVEKITYSCATRVYPNSFGLKEFILVNKLCGLKKLHVIGNGSSNGINTTYFSKEQIPTNELQRYRNKIGITTSDFVLIFVGRLVADKGINELIQALKKVKSKHDNVKLLLVGPYENNLDPLLPETLMEIEDDHNIISVGYQNDVRPYLAISNALIFPSYREGFPNVPMQAGAMGLPCIVTDINGCNEIITHEDNGLIIPPKNCKELEKAMFRILEDKKLTQKMASNARHRIVSRFDQQTIWRLIKEEYDEQLKLAGISTKSILTNL